MTRKRILNDVKSYCEKEYGKITDWVHDIAHIHRVVAVGRKLCAMEKLSPKNTFLVELACWLHDLGRVGEATGYLFTESNHAEISYLKAKDVLKPFERKMGRDSVTNVLMAVREHNLPVLKHPENLIGRMLVDSDRGAGIHVIGIFTMIDYLKVVKTGAIYTKEEARASLDTLEKKLVAKDKVAEAIEKISYLKDWYYGSSKQSKTKHTVAVLYTRSAKKLFKNDMEEVEQFIARLET